VAPFCSALGLRGAGYSLYTASRQKKEIEDEGKELPLIEVGESALLSARNP
jgi:hypothetical protein